jgi:hypothetical protein
MVTPRQVGSSAEVHFGIPETRGSRPAQQLIRAELVRVTYSPGAEAPVDPDAFRRRGEAIASIEQDPLPAEGRLVLVDLGLDRLDDDPTGYTLRYAVRLRDRRGRPSPLVVAEDLVLLATPGAPRGLRAEPTSDGVRLVWDPPAGDGPFEFNVYRSGTGQPPAETPINTEPLTVTEFLDSGVISGDSYVYAVRVSLATGAPRRESASSNAVELVAEDRFAPAAPEGLVVVQEGEAIRLFWNPNRERDLAGYRVFRRVDGGEWERIGPEPVEQPLFLDADVRIDQRIDYRLTAIDRASPTNESPPSESVEVIVLQEPATPSETRP